MRLQRRLLATARWLATRLAAPLVVVAVILAVTHAACAATGEPAATADAQGDWFQSVFSRVEAEATNDVAKLPAVGEALVREWRSLDRAGSAAGAFVDLGWVVIAAIAAWAVERAVGGRLARRPLRRMHEHGGNPSANDIGLLVLCDLVGLAAFLAVFGLARRHFLPVVGVSEMMGMLAVSVLERWRFAALIVRVILRPRVPKARLVDIADGEARRLSRLVTAAILAVIILIAIARMGLMDEDNGAAHVIGLLVAVVVCALYMTLVVRARRVGEALIRGRRVSGAVGAIRGALARAWLPGGLVLVAGLFLTFVAGLSLGLLSYYRAVSATLGVLLVVLVLDGLAARAWYDDTPTESIRAVAPESLTSRAIHRIIRALVVVIATLMLASIWLDAIEPNHTAAMHAAIAAIVTLFAALIAWELARLAIDQNLQASHGAAPGAADDDEEITPATRLQTALPLLRAAVAVLIAVVAVLVVLSQLGVNTAPLIAGASIFGLAVSFGSQALVRDVISGIFYMWDDAFRMGEYIDTGRLKGTVEALGVRSVKLRHQNGPLHTIPYGQLGAVTNLSRDFATIKFNLRFDPRTDIELVRRAAKQIGIAMVEENEEMATEVMAPLKLQGVAEVVDSALVLRFKFTARPVKPSWVQREYMKRMVKVFAEKGIAFASGTLTLQTVSPSENLPALAIGASPAKDVPPVQGAVVALASGAVEVPGLPAPAA